MLTQIQIINSAKTHGMTYGIKFLPESPLFTNKLCLMKFAREIYAAGMAAGEAKERERCANEKPTLTTAMTAPTIGAWPR